MTNKEFYFDKLLAVALENACGTFHRVVHGKNCGGKELRGLRIFNCRKHRKLAQCRTRQTRATIVKERRRPEAGGLGYG